MNYQEYERICIGSREYPRLCLIGPSLKGELMAKILLLGGDDIYYGYLVDGEAPIGRHYHLLCSFKHWMQIYDHRGMCKEIAAPFSINVYRAKGYAVIIQLVNGKKPQ